MHGNRKPDRRLTPRPLPAHLTSAITLWLSSRAALASLRSEWQPSSGAGRRLCKLVAEIDRCGRDKVAAALDGEIARRAETWLAGLESYRGHPFRRCRQKAPVLWQAGTTRLLDYGRSRDGPIVMVVPSLINRFHVLDLLPEHSFLRHLAKAGLRPVVVDWDAPGEAERHFRLSEYVTERLEAAFAAAQRIAPGPIGIIGYCMGGLLALALALRRQHDTGCLALLATPWNFYAESGKPASLAHAIADILPATCSPDGTVPVDVIQTLFFVLDPFAAERKFIRFASLAEESPAARSFVALEDWVNDGVPLPLGVARECMRSWYGDNDPGRGLWRVAGQLVDPKLLRRPVLVVVPSRDRIVPPSSAEPLAVETGATVLRPRLGHVGMMSAARAPALLWTPIAEWLRTRLRKAR
ncbi:MAG: alpha/beta fold hydrolase [Alphaproteobacteria bacterium]|nr:alpha/beta fold hydrolase [Alphaproteobacteria bacterium]